MNDKITIQGSAPKYDEQVLKQRQSARHNVYDSTDECTALVRGDISTQFLINVIDYHTKGYTLSTKYPVSVGYENYSCRMLKPLDLQAVDREAIDAQVKLEYVAWLESERESYKQQLTAQLLQTAQDKERKREEDKRTKLLLDIQKEVDATFADLVIPD